MQKPGFDIRHQISENQGLFSHLLQALLHFSFEPHPVFVLNNL